MPPPEPRNLLSMGWPAVIRDTEPSSRWMCTGLAQLLSDRKPYSCVLPSVLEGQGTQWVCSFDCAFARRVPEYTSVSAVGSESSVGIVELVYAV